MGAAKAGGDDPQTPPHAFGGTTSRRDPAGTSPLCSSASSSCAAVNGGGRVIGGSVTKLLDVPVGLEGRTIVELTGRVVDEGAGFGAAFSSEPPVATTATTTPAMTSAATTPIRSRILELMRGSPPSPDSHRRSQVSQTIDPAIRSNWGRVPRTVAPCDR